MTRYLALLSIVLLGFTTLGVNAVIEPSDKILVQYINVDGLTDPFIKTGETAALGFYDASLEEISSQFADLEDGGEVIIPNTSSTAACSLDTVITAAKEALGTPLKQNLQDLVAQGIDLVQFQVSPNVLPQACQLNDSIFFQDGINVSSTPISNINYIDIKILFDLEEFIPTLPEDETNGFLGHTNLTNKYDVNNDGDVTALDALLVINLLSRIGFDLPTDENVTTSSGTIIFPDVNNSNSITSSDALQVINELGRSDNPVNEGVSVNLDGLITVDTYATNIRIYFENAGFRLLLDNREIDLSDVKVEALDVNPLMTYSRVYVYGSDFFETAEFEDGTLHMGTFPFLRQQNLCVNNNPYYMYVYSGGGNDWVTINDSAGSDVLTAYDSYTRIYSYNPRYRHYYIGFDLVRADSFSGGSDRLYDRTSDAVELNARGDWLEL